MSAALPRHGGYNYNRFSFVSVMPIGEMFCGVVFGGEGGGGGYADKITGQVFKNGPLGG